MLSGIYEVIENIKQPYHRALLRWRNSVSERFFSIVLTMCGIFCFFWIAAFLVLVMLKLM